MQRVGLLCRRVAVPMLAAALLVVGCAEREPASTPPFRPAVVNVAHFGAVGDGVTDDRPSIQRALDQAGSAGAAIYFPAGTFRLATASLPRDRILVIQPNQTLVGAGRDLSRLVVGAAFGPYVTVIGAVHDSLGTGSWTMRELTIDQNARSQNDLDTGLMTTFPKMALRLGDYGTGSRITVQQSAFSDSDSVNTLYLFAAMVQVVETHFRRIGGLPGRAPHDHSTIYVTATADDSIQHITRNSFSGVRSSGGSVTAIETHGGVQVITDNLISDYLRGFNLTGVSASRTTGATVSKNLVNRAAIGIQLWSQEEQGSSGTGLRNVQLADNKLILDGAAWQSSGLVAPTAGIFLTTSNTAPIRGISITRNHILYASANLGAQVRPYSAAVSCRVSRPAARPTRVVIVDNVIARAPVAIDSACMVDGARIDNNKITG